MFETKVFTSFIQGQSAVYTQTHQKEHSHIHTRRYFLKLYAFKFYTIVAFLQINIRYFFDILHYSRRGFLILCSGVLSSSDTIRRKKRYWCCRDGNTQDQQLNKPRCSKKTAPQVPTIAQ